MSERDSKRLESIAREHRLDLRSRIDRRIAEERLLSEEGATELVRGTVAVEAALGGVVTDGIGDRAAYCLGQLAHVAHGPEPTGEIDGAEAREDRDEPGARVGHVRRLFFRRTRAESSSLMSSSGKKVGSSRSM